LLKPIKKEDLTGSIGAAFKKMYAAKATNNID